MSAAVDWVRKMQRANWLSGYEPPSPNENLAPYVQLGDTSIPYSLDDPAAIRELKLALRSLGQLCADPLRTPDPAIETRWQGIVVDEDVPTWDAATADEFAIAVGRYRGWGWQVPGPYAQSTPGGPQPTATGLELIAGAVNELLGGLARMSLYESWRAGAFAPPSVISGPPPTAPVIPASYFGPDWLAEPVGTDPALSGQIRDAETMLTQAHAAAMTAENEQQRAEHAATMLLARSLRGALVKEAQAQASVRQGQTTVEPVAPDACARLGGRYDAATGACVRAEAANASTGEPSSIGWIVLAVGGLLIGAGLLEKRRGRAPRIDGPLGARR